MSNRFLTIHLREAALHADRARFETDLAVETEGVTVQVERGDLAWSGVVPWATLDGDPQRLIDMIDTANSAVARQIDDAMAASAGVRHQPRPPRYLP